MIARIIEASVRHRAFVLMVAALLAAVGVWAARNTPIDAIPDLSDVQVIVYTEYPGQAPQVVEDQVTYPLTTALLAVPTAKTVRGYSFFGYSLVYVIFEDGTDVYWARSRVLEGLNVAQGRLPDNASAQLGPDASGVGWVYQYALSDFSPRSRVLRAALDADGSGRVEAGELPIPEASSSGRDVEAGVYSTDQLRELFVTANPPPIDGGGDFAEASLRFIVQAFDRDADGAISAHELERAANFRGLDLAQLRTVQDWTLRYDLTSLEGVAEVATVGGYVRQYQIEVDPEKLRAFGVTIADVRRGVQNANIDAGGRLIEMGETEFMVRGRGTISSLQDLETIPVLPRHGAHTPVLLRQVARVQLGPAARRGLAELNGAGEVVSGIVVQRYGANARAVIDRVEARLAELIPTLPEGVEVHVGYDRSALIDRAVASLTATLIEEMLVVALVCGLFLLHLRSALVAVITIPIGVLGAFIGMYALGLSATIMSLGGMAIAIGVMVDAAVVLVENLHKHRERDPHASQEALVIRAATEVGPALFFSLAIITVSFLPVFALENQEGRLFTPLAWTKTLTMATATVLAVTLIPALMVYLVRGRIRPEGEHPVSRVLIAGYRPMVRAAVRWPVLTLVGAAALMGISLWPASQLGSEFMPPLDEGDLLYMPTTPPGLSITKARELLQQTDKLIVQHPQVAHVLGKIGRADTATDPAPLTMIETIIVLTPRDTWPGGKTIEDVASELDGMVQLPGVTNGWTMPIKTRIDMLATGIKTPVGIKLLGDDLEELAELGERIEGLLGDVEGTSSVYAERALGGRYIDIDIRREDAARYGANVSDVQDVVRTAIGGMEVSTTIEGLERYPISIRYPRELRGSVAALKQVSVPTPMGHTVPLSQVADVTISQGPPAIKSENARRTVWVYVDLDTADIGGFVERAKRVLRERLDVPAGVSIVWSGQVEYMERAQQRLLVVVPLTLGLVFILLYLHTRRLADTALVMVTVPFALVGGVWLLWALEFNLSVAVAVGFVALAGLAAETGVVMLVYLDEAWHRLAPLGHVAQAEAVVAGAVERVRPKVMTVATTLLGLLPVMLVHGTGSRVMQRIAAPMVGGLLSSAALTLVVIPAAYLLIRRLRRE